MIGGSYNPYCKSVGCTVLVNHIHLEGNIVSAKSFKCGRCHVTLGTDLNNADISCECGRVYIIRDGKLVRVPVDKGGK